MTKKTERVLVGAGLVAVIVGAPLALVLLARRNPPPPLAAGQVGFTIDPSTGQPVRDFGDV